MMIGSDFHGEHVDPLALHSFIESARRFQPDVIVLNGDVTEFSEVSRWGKNPNMVLDLQKEIDFVVDNILRPIREAAPKAMIDFVVGNHDIRIALYLAGQAPGLASLRCLGFDELFKLKELNIGLVMGGNPLTVTEPQKRSVAKKAYKLYYDTFIATHGTATGKDGARRELSRFGISGTSGHLHTPADVYSASVDRPHLEWHTTGCMAKTSVGDTYMGGLPVSWQVGWGLAYIFPKSKTVHWQHILRRADRIIVEGIVYEDESLPS